MDQDLYRKLMMEPSVLQGIGAVAVREAEREIQKQELDFAKKYLLQQTTNPPISIIGHLAPLSPITMGPYEGIHEERVRRRTSEIFQDYLSRLDLLEELKNKGYRIIEEECWSWSNHDDAGY